MNNTNNLLQSSNNTNQSSQGKQGSHPKEDYLGLVAASIPVSELFQKYGNIYDVKRQFLVAYDRNGNIMADPVPGFVGKNFQDPEIQKVTNSNEVFNRIINNLLNGRQDRDYILAKV